MISLITIIVTLILVGVALYLVELIPMDVTIKKIVYVLVVVATILWLLQAFGVIGSVGIFGF
jgi:hypothetical protein